MSHPLSLQAILHHLALRRRSFFFFPPPAGAVAAGQPEPAFSAAATHCCRWPAAAAKATAAELGALWAAAAAGQAARSGGLRAQPLCFRFRGARARETHTPVNLRISPTAFGRGAATPPRGWRWVCFIPGGMNFKEWVARAAAEFGDPPQPAPSLWTAFLLFRSHGQGVMQLRGSLHRAGKCRKRVADPPVHLDVYVLILTFLQCSPSFLCTRACTWSFHFASFSRAFAPFSTTQDLESSTQTRLLRSGASGATIWQPGPCPGCAGWLSWTESFHRPGVCTHIHITNWLITHWVTWRSPLPWHLLDACPPREHCHDPGRPWPSLLPWFSEYQSTVRTTPERAPWERNGWNCPLPAWPRSIVGDQWPACTFQPEHCPTRWPSGLALPEPAEDRIRTPLRPALPC